MKWKTLQLLQQIVSKRSIMPTRHELILQFMLALASNSDVTQKAHSPKHLYVLAADMVDEYLSFT